MAQLEKLEFYVKPLSPFRLDLTAWALRRRQSNMVDRFDGLRYQRVITSDEKALGMSVIQTGSIERARLKVEITGKRLGSAESRVAQKYLELLLGLRIDLRRFYESARLNPKFGDLARRFLGVKPPRFPSIFEALVNAISCQQVSLTVGLLLMNRLAQNYGPRLSDQTSAVAFPRPQDLSKLKQDMLRKLGFSVRKSRYIIGLARSIIGGQVNLENISGMKDDEALEYLQQIPGIGRWSAQYALLRGLGRLHRFPADDIGAQNGLKRLMGLRKRPDYQRTSELLESLQPYAGLVYFHLLLNRLDQEGLLKSKI
ncbi:MAG: DNA-3-methyladenine glycosylase family protein [Nitrososphaerales archaeon]